MLEKALGSEEVQASLAEKRDLMIRLLARLAHEIRNPLSSLGIHLELMEEDLGTLAPEMRQQLAPRLNIIQGELHRLESVVSQFLRLAGPSALDLEHIQLGRVITHVCELLRPEAEARSIQISAEIKGELPEIMADPVRLTQALLNLVINAVQAVDRNGRIDIKAGAAADALWVSVRDTGPGIPPEKLASIFDPYFTTKTEGHGLGLWIAQQIAVAHGGSLQAGNAAGGGAEFTLLVPRKTPVAPAS